MTEVISIRFKNKGKVYYFDPAGIQVSDGDNVIVETAKGTEYAWCSEGNHEVDDSTVVQPLRPVLRIATDADTARYEDNRKREAEAFSICQDKIEKHGMDMKLVDVEYSFDGSKILFFFTSDGRVDFRDLVKDLASVFKTRIELRQIGVRDEARMLGGLGICGNPFCCSQFLDEFHPVSIKMAKTQGLSLNPTKISGTCGRLMCCLKYEQAAYEDLIKKAPKIDSFVDTTSGKGSVISVNLLRSNAKVRLEDSGDTTLRSFPFDELEVLGGKARRAEYIAARAEGKLEEAGFKPSPKPKEAPPMPEFKFVSGATPIRQRGEEPPAEHRRQPEQKSASEQAPSKRRNRFKHGSKPKADAAAPSPAADQKPPKAAQQEQKQQKRSPFGKKQPGGQPPKRDANPAPQQGTPAAPAGQQGDAPAKKSGHRRYYRGKKKSGPPAGGEA